MASRKSSRVLLAVTITWMAFGSWLLFRTDPESGFDPLVGHVVVFFFVSAACFGLLLRPLGVVRGLLVGTTSILVVAGISELLQPILTATRQAQSRDLAANSAGIAAAFFLTAFLCSVLRDPGRRELSTALICGVGLVLSAAAIAVGGDRIDAVVTCWGRGLDGIESAEGAPLIRVEGESVRFGDETAQPLGDGIVAADSADLRCSVLESGSYSIVATVVPASTQTGGPMRIFTSSESTNFSDENTHLGQEFDAISVRVRSNDELQWESVPGVFVAGERVTVAMVVANGQATVFVDGEQRATFDLVGESFNDWRGDFPILIGDEFTRDRTYEGDIEIVSFFDRALLEGDPALAASQG